MEVIGVVSGIMGIITFIVACIQLFKRLRSKLKKIPEIVQRVIRELKAAEALMRRASQVMKGDFPFDAIVDINTALTVCERCVRRLSLTAERVEQDTARDKIFPAHRIPELEEQREKLGDGVLELTSELRLLEW